MVTKLTLSLNPRVVSQAKQYAKRRGVSVSHIVETYLSAVSSDPAAPADSPILRSLRGTLKNADLSDYREHLASKYR